MPGSRDGPRAVARLRRGARASRLGVTQALRSGERALSHLRTHHNGYDLIVLDVMMPHPTGVEVYQTLLEEGITVPTIFVSGYHDPPVLDGMLDAAGVVFLQKPFRQADLADAIARCLESCGRTTSVPPPPETLPSPR